MKFSPVLLLALSSTLSNALPQPFDSNNVLESREISTLDSREANPFPEADSEELWKRKGGGGKGGSSSSGSSSSGSSSSGSSSGGSSSGGSSSGSRGGLGSSSSSTGGRTTTGSGVRPAYGGGKYYGGGAAVPYRSGGRSASGISPFLFLGVGAFAVFPALWLYGVYSYPYVHPYNFRNATANNENQTKPVQCLCEEYSECGCDENGDNTYLAELIGNGSYPALNKSVITVADINGTSTILINGTLPNGTTADGGTDSADATDAGVMLKASGYWLMVAFVGCTVFLT